MYRTPIAPFEARHRNQLDCYFFYHSVLYFISLFFVVFFLFFFYNSLVPFPAALSNPFPPLDTTPSCLEIQQSLRIIIILACAIRSIQNLPFPPLSLSSSFSILNVFFLFLGNQPRILSYFINYIHFFSTYKHYFSFFTLPWIILLQKLQTFSDF